MFFRLLWLAVKSIFLDYRIKVIRADHLKEEKKRQPEVKPSSVDDEPSVIYTTPCEEFPETFGPCPEDEE